MNRLFWSYFENLCFISLFLRWKNLKKLQTVQNPLDLFFIAILAQSVFFAPLGFSSDRAENQVRGDSSLVLTPGPDEGMDLQATDSTIEDLQATTESRADEPLKQDEVQGHLPKPHSSRAHKSKKNIHSSPKSVLKKKKSSSSKADKKWHLFEWRKGHFISLEWAYGFLNQKDKDLYAPLLLKENINTKSFKNETLLYLNFHRNIIRFPYVLDWGLRGSVGVARSYALNSDYFFPLSVSGIVSLKIYKHQAIIPFLEGGLSSWNMNTSSDFSEMFPFWTVGVFVSFSLFKPSLSYVFVNDYGVQDMGFILEFKNHLSPFSVEETGAFLRTLHVGLYVHF